VTLIYERPALDLDKYNLEVLSTARGYVRVEGDLAVARVIDSIGTVVWEDNTGAGGWLGLVTLTERMVGVVRAVEDVGHVLEPWAEVMRRYRAWNDLRGTL
jgi:hypothetical protein